MDTLKRSFDSTILDAISDMIFVLKVNNGEFVYDYMNHSAKISRAFKNDFIGKTVHEANKPDLATILQKHYETVTRDGVCIIYKDTYLSKSENIYYFDTRIIPLFNESMDCKYIVTVIKQISKEMNIVDRIEDDLQIVANHSNDLITIINTRGIIIFASPSYQNVLGFDKKEYLGKSFLTNIYPNDQARVSKIMTDALNDKQHFKLHFKQYNNKNELIWSEANASPVFNEDKEVKHMVIITRDVSNQKKYEAKLEYFAHHDALTELPNRRLFKKRLNNTLKTFKKNNTNIAVIMLDIDNFKMINDQFGHSTGDDVIIEFGNRIKKTLAMKNTVSRLGGDEFVILLPHIESLEAATQICHSIQHVIKQPWVIGDYYLEITASIGLTFASPKDATPYTMLRDADRALYQAKNSGKNTYKLIHEELN